MSLSDQNCPKCGHTLEDVSMFDTRCVNANCDLESREELVDYCKKHGIKAKDIRR